MKTLASVAALALAVACGSGGGSSGTTGSNGGGSTGGSAGTTGGTSSGGSGSSGGGGSNGGDSQYNTLKGTFTTVGGISATLAGAIQGNWQGVGIPSTWALTSTFGSGDQGSVPLTVTSPAGDTAAMTLSEENTNGTAPAAETLTCVANDSGSQVNLGLTVKNASGTLVADFTGTNGSCALTLDTPTLVTGDTYFAHGSLTATLNGTLPDGGPDTGTLNATF